MPLEREFKYLVRLAPEFRRENYACDLVEQAYLRFEDPEIRVRNCELDPSLTVKWPTDSVGVREELVIPLEPELVQQILDGMRHGRRITKWRVTMGDGWVVDVYEDDLQGLIIAEWEVPEGAPFVEPPRPSWMDARLDVTDHPLFSNRNLARTSYFDLHERFKHHIMLAYFLPLED